MELTTRNVNTGLIDMLWKMRHSGQPYTSRGGDVLRIMEPVLVTYVRPKERVLFNAERDANPYFHLMESLWMLAGRNDVKWIAAFNKRMREFSDDEHHFHGAYGHRWRNHFKIDQLLDLIHLLEHEPNTRRAVLAMWDPRADLDAESNDLPCNTHIYFDIVDGELNMTVCNRSNDIIWGMFGANAVHMSFLQEVMASMLNLRVGLYRQFSNNAHLYLDIGQGKDLLMSRPTEAYDPYGYDGVSPYPIVADPKTWFDDLENFMEEGDYTEIKNPFFHEIAIPMWDSWFARKEGRDNGMKDLLQMPDCDWKRACMEWINRREAK